MQLTGIEIAPEAIACAKQSAAELGLTRLQFQALDSTRLLPPRKCRSWCWLTRRAAALVNRYVIISQRWHRVLSSTPAVTPKPWRKISASCRVIASNGYSFSTCSPHRALRSADTAGKNVNTSLKSISLRHTSILNNNRDRSININRSIMVIYCAIFANQITNNQIRSLNELF